MRQNINVGDVVKWEDVTSSGGLNAPLANNQWLIVMRVGFHPEYGLLLNTFLIIIFGAAKIMENG